ncbi:MAG TPA: hypothetical protein VHA37_06895 [Candidatus Saccharimonadales bacterium]|nr:hypothetical protein [Candidatus Saccharimonadales bacterium]
MTTTSDVKVTPGTGANVATYDVTEDAETKKLQRLVINDSDGDEVKLGSAGSIETIDISSTDYTLAKVSRGIMVATAGNLNVTMEDGSTGIIPALQPGVLYPFALSVVKKTSTTATGIVSFP